MSLQVVLSLHSLQDIWFASTLYVSHGRCFSQFHTNFRFDEDLVLSPEPSLALLRVGVLVV